MRKKEECFCEICGVSSTIKRVNFIKMANMHLCENIEINSNDLENLKILIKEVCLILMILEL